MQYLIILLRIVIGGFFIFSGIIKLYPIETFELTFVDLGIVSWTIAPFFARVLIAYELFLGLLLLLNTAKRSIHKQILALLLFFTAYLTYILITQGNDSNCGCLGSQFYITPAESIIKNAVLIVLTILLVKYDSYNEWLPKWTIPMFIAISLATPLILNPITFSTPNLLNVKLPYTIDYLNEIPKPIDNGKEIDLSKGEMLIGLFSCTCQHCKHASYKLKIAAEKYDLPPIYIVFKGAKSQKELDLQESKKDKFFKESNSEFPYSFFNDERIFKMTKGVFPTVMYVVDGEVRQLWTGGQLSYEELEKLESTIEKIKN